MLRIRDQKLARADIAGRNPPVLISEPAYRRGLPLIAAIAVMLVSVVMVMLGPILLPLASELKVTVAVAGQLAAATSLVWGLAAIPIGAISDTYGRRRVLLMGLILISVALIASALATSYAALFAARILTGLAAAMIPPTCYAACADLPTPAQSTRALSWTLAGGMLGGALGMPLVAWLANLGHWRTPFIVLCLVLAAMAAGVWASFPRHVAEKHSSVTFFSNVRQVGNHGAALWLLLAVNFLLQAASWGTMSYLPAYLMQTYQQTTGAIALPLLLNGAGVVCGVMIGGKIAAHQKRNVVAIGALLLGGLLLAFAFATAPALWTTVAITASAGGMFTFTQPLLMSSLFARAGQARGTVSGILALSTQIGAMAGVALGGAMLALGGFAYVGLGCLTVAACAAVVMALAMRKAD